MRKVFVEVKMNITMVVNEGIEISEVINKANYEFNDMTGAAFITDTEITDYQVLDSK